MRRALALLSALCALPFAAAAADDPALVHARELLSRVILVDGHNDLPAASARSSGRSTSPARRRATSREPSSSRSNWRGA
jgi:hypothetical protein